jgi:response regulator RpfG family c-di-GMP phosphodiesterase
MKLFLKIFAYTTFVSTSLLVIFAYINVVMVVGYAYEPRLSIGPTVIGIFIGSIISIITFILVKRVKQLEHEKTIESIEAQREIIYILGEATESRSSETGSHIKRVAKYSYLLAKLYGLSDKEADLIKIASPLHDIGKVAIPDSILLKPGKLTEDEFNIMKTHAQIGYGILSHSTGLVCTSAATIALQHHEKWDGTGYPNQFKGEEIHIYGRIICICDVFDALMSKRVYKDSWNLEKVVALFCEQNGRHFDPELCGLFLENIEQFEAIHRQNSDSIAV